MEDDWYPSSSAQTYVPNAMGKGEMPVKYKIKLGIVPELWEEKAESYFSTFRLNDQQNLLCDIGAWPSVLLSLPWHGTEMQGY